MGRTDLLRIEVEVHELVMKSEGFRVFRATRALCVSASDQRHPEGTPETVSKFEVQQIHKPNEAPCLIPLQSNMCTIASDQESPHTELRSKEFRRGEDEGKTMSGYWSRAPCSGSRSRRFLFSHHAKHVAGAVFCERAIQRPRRGTSESHHSGKTPTCATCAAAQALHLQACGARSRGCQRPRPSFDIWRRFRAFSITRIYLPRPSCGILVWRNRHRSTLVRICPYGSVHLASAILTSILAK